MKITVETATLIHLEFVDEICATIEASAKVRGTGIAKRTPETIQNKIKAGKYIFVAKENIFEKTPKELEKDFKYAMKKLDLLKN